MPINSPYNQYDFNKNSGQTTQSILQKLSLLAYDATKFLISFITSMIKMVMGK